jgi:tetratricopeptide (TPR) repeat protein
MAPSPAGGITRTAQACFLILLLALISACNRSPGHKYYIRAIDDDLALSSSERLELLDQAIRFESENPEYYETRGTLNFDTGNYDRAYTDLTQSAAYDGNKQPYRLYLKGLSEGRLGKYHEAQKDLEHAVSLWPDNAQFYNGLALAYISQGRANEAISLAEKAISLQPNVSRWKYLHGTALACAGKNDQAVQAFNKAVFFTYAASPKGPQRDVFFDGNVELKRIGQCRPQDLKEQWHYGGRWMPDSVLSEYRNK